MHSWNFQLASTVTRRQSFSFRFCHKALFEKHFSPPPCPLLRLCRFNSKPRGWACHMQLEVEACVLCFQLPNWEKVGSLRGSFFQSNRDSTSTFLWPCQARLACLFSVLSLQCQELSDLSDESPRHRMAASVHKVKLLPPWGNEVARSARTSRQKKKRRWAQWSYSVV
jgi:hypothetical protein